MHGFYSNKVYWIKQIKQTIQIETLTTAQDYDIILVLQLRKLLTKSFRNV